MDVEAGVLLEAHGEVGQELSGRSPQLAPGPGHGDLRIGVHGFAGLGHRVIVVAGHGDGPAVTLRHDPLHHFLGLRTIAHVVAEEHEATGAMALRVLQAGLQRPSIGVDVSQDGDAHGTS
jgi:hypothetical protein